MEHVFVYGTLRLPQPNIPADDYRYHLQIAAYLQNAVPAQLNQANLFDLGSYPAATPGQNILYGDLLTVLPEALAIMDRIEGHPTFYKRAKVTVETNTGPHAAWIYWAPQGLTIGKNCITGGDWFQRGPHNPLLTGDNRADIPVDVTLQSLVQHFAASSCSWLSSVRSDGRAHSAPVWHVWYKGRAYVVTTTNAVKTANIYHNPSVVISHPDPTDPIIIEGWATFTPSLRAALRPAFQAKYQWDLNTDTEYNTIVEITPTKLMAWGKHGQGHWPGADVLKVWLD